MQVKKAENLSNLKKSMISSQEESLGICKGEIYQKIGKKLKKCTKLKNLVKN